MMEHELSAFYDITHGLGLAILTPRWLKYVLDENTARKSMKLLSSMPSSVSVLLSPSVMEEEVGKSVDCGICTVHIRKRRICPEHIKSEVIYHD